jgi:hypothetical protein
MSSLSDIRGRVVGAVKDDAGKLANPDDYDRNIHGAIARYSRHRPDLDVVDVTGNGTHDYGLPTGWVDEFSMIDSIEYPSGDVPASFLDSQDYGIYRTPTADKIRLVSNEPSATETFRLTFTIPRTATTIPANDEEALVNLAASLCCEDLANAYAQTGDSTLNADVVNYRTKSTEFAARAKRLMALYKEHLGIKEGDSTSAASAVADFDEKYPGGSERLTHARWARDKR